MGERYVALFTVYRKFESLMTYSTNIPTKSVTQSNNDLALPPMSAVDLPTFITTGLLRNVANTNEGVPLPHNVQVSTQQLMSSMVDEPMGAVNLPRFQPIEKRPPARRRHAPSPRYGNRQPRIKRYDSGRLIPSLDSWMITREEALAEVKQALLISTKNPKAIQLMSLFHLQDEELAEAGVRYETLKQLSPLLQS
jgi:hypothetical protein